MPSMQRRARSVNEFTFVRQTNQLDYACGTVTLNRCFFFISPLRRAELIQPGNRTWRA